MTTKTIQINGIDIVLDSNLTRDYLFTVAIDKVQDLLDNEIIHYQSYIELKALLQGSNFESLARFILADSQSELVALQADCMTLYY